MWYLIIIIIIENPLNSIIFWTRQLGDASNFTMKYSSIFRRSVISTWRRVHSIPRHVKNAIRTPMAYHTCTQCDNSLDLELSLDS